MGEEQRADVGDRELQRENARLLEELQMTYGQMAEIMESAERERQVTYEELRQRNEELEARLKELEEAHARLQETQRLLLRAERLSAMGQLAAAIVHEINTPLTVISAKVELMLLEGQEETVRTDLEEILQGVWRLDELVQNTLRVARQGHSQVKRVDLDEVVDQVHRFIGPLAKRVDLRVEMAGGLPQVMADPGQVEQMLTNFLTNAIDALKDHDEPLICVATGVVNPADLQQDEEANGWQTGLALDAGKEDPGEPRVCVEVRDNGPGISAGQLGEIFETFFTTKGEDKGTGLGLAISRRIARDHGGNILVASCEGHGSSFRLLLPPAAEES